MVPSFGAADYGEQAGRELCRTVVNTTVAGISKTSTFPKNVNNKSAHVGSKWRVFVVGKSARGYRYVFINWNGGKIQTRIFARLTANCGSLHSRRTSCGLTYGARRHRLTTVAVDGAAVRGLISGRSARTKLYGIDERKTNWAPRARSPRKFERRLRKSVNVFRRPIRDNTYRHVRTVPGAIRLRFGGMGRGGVISRRSIYNSIRKTTRVRRKYVSA